MRRLTVAPRRVSLLGRIVAGFVTLLLLLLLAARTAHGQAGLDSVVPRSPVPNGFISDGGPVLDAASLARLNARITEIQRVTSGDIGVAIIRDLHDRAPVDVGVAIYRAWKIGHIDSIGSTRRDLGALLLIVPKELAPSHRGECWITTGRGAEGELIDAEAGAICRDSVIPHLKTRDYAGAVSAGIEAIGEQFTVATANASATPSDASVPNVVSDEPRESHRGVPMFVSFLLGGVGLGGAAAGTMAWRRRRPRQCPRGHGPMVRLSESEDDAALDAGQRKEEQLGSLDYDVWACRVCDERIVIPYGAWRSAYQGCPQCGYRTVQPTTRTLVHATHSHGGREEITLDCRNCGWHDVTQRSTPRLQSSSGSSGGGGGGGGGSSFGGSGATSGGGGGSSY